MPRVVISLVTWNSEKDLPRCLESIAAQTFRDVALVIVDNASEDGTRAWIANYELGIRNQGQYRFHNSLFIIPNSTNLGYAGAHNQSMRWARENRAELVLVLNPDVVLEPDAIAVMVAAMERHLKAASVGIPLLRDSKTIDSLGLMVGWGGRFLEKGAGKRLDPGSPQSGVRDDNRVLGISGACAMYRLAALEEVAYHRQTEAEYFDERFFAYKEDIDLALRLRKVGWEAWLIHGARALHSRALRSDCPRSDRGHRKNYLSYRNHLFILKKHWRDLPTPRWQIIFYEFGKAVYALLREPWLLKAWAEVWKLPPPLAGSRKMR